VKVYIESEAVSVHSFAMMVDVLAGSVVSLTDEQTGTECRFLFSYVFIGERFFRFGIFIPCSFPHPSITFSVLLYSSLIIIIRINFIPRVSFSRLLAENTLTHVSLPLPGWSDTTRRYNQSPPPSRMTVLPPSLKQPTLPSLHVRSSIRLVWGYPSSPHHLQPLIFPWQ
jgi:hypothetical protein